MHLSWRVIHHPRPHGVIFVVNGVGVTLKHWDTINMSTTVSVGHNIALSILYLDQHGNPMLVAPAPDSAPSWSNTTPAVETLKPSPDGLTAEADALTVGSDVITLNVTVGGKSFSAILSVTVQDVPQVLTAVEIAPVVS